MTGMFKSVVVAAVFAVGLSAAAQAKVPVAKPFVPPQGSSLFTPLSGYLFGTAMAVPAMLILRAGYVAYTENRQLTQTEANETFFGTLIQPLGVYYVIRDLTQPPANPGKPKPAH